jgi:hypothetical protein
MSLDNVHKSSKELDDEKVGAHDEQIEGANHENPATPVSPADLELFEDEEPKLNRQMVLAFIVSFIISHSKTLD